MPLNTSNFYVSGTMDASRILMKGEDLVLTHIANYLTDGDSIGSHKILYAEAADITPGCFLASGDLYELSLDITNTGAIRINKCLCEGTWQLNSSMNFAKVGSKLYIAGLWTRVL